MNTQQFSAESLINNAFAGITVANEENSELVATLLDKYNLRWTVAKTPLLLPTGEETGFFGIVREDNHKVFSTCKDSYVPYQNSELAELLIRISEKTGYEIHSGGQFNGGGKVYIQLNTGNQITNLGKNRTTVQGYVTGINSHDGTTSLKWGETNITICCRNTFAMASKRLQQSARHTTNIHSRVEENIRLVTGIADAEKTIFDSFIKLSDVPVTRDNIAKIVKQVTEVDITKTRSEQEDQYSTYALNRSDELSRSIAREMNAKGESLWGLFSGVTHYTSHVLPVPKRENARLESKYAGSALDIDNTAYAAIMEMVN